ncbi:hypothetical protein AAFF_G00279790 [Aldrovandia affinis]|uniref:Uncharacterized protein n=1 Tax=Aldrovandia affinis TaxID=143900 RepID=A0AAD7SRF4_9TELE|nr:hypothetical protein AAFF_G00279790 [Aldrovandia affinis]
MIVWPPPRHKPHPVSDLNAGAGAGGVQGVADTAVPILHTERLLSPVREPEKLRQWPELESFQSPAQEWCDTAIAMEGDIVPARVVSVSKEQLEEAIKTGDLEMSLHQPMPPSSASHNTIFGSATSMKSCHTLHIDVFRMSLLLRDKKM